MDAQQAIASITAASIYAPDILKPELAQVVKFIVGMASSPLQEATSSELFNEMRRRFYSAIFAGARLDGKMAWFYGGTLHDCVGLAEVTKCCLISTLRPEPYDRGSAPTMTEDT